MSEKRNQTLIRVAVITGIFGIIIAVITGIFGLINAGKVDNLLSNASTPTPLSAPTSVTRTAFTVNDANQVVLREDCGYSIDDYTLAQDDTVPTRTFDLANYPSGIVIGEAVMATIDGHLLGSSGVTFIIELIEPEERRYLEIKDGAFFIVVSENAKGWLRLRERHLECRGKDRETVYFP